MGKMRIWILLYKIFFYIEGVSFQNIITLNLKTDCLGKKKNPLHYPMCSAFDRKSILWVIRMLKQNKCPADNITGEFEQRKFTEKNEIERKIKIRIMPG